MTQTVAAGRSILAAHRQRATPSGIGCGVNADLAWLLFVPAGALLMTLLRIQEGPVLRVPRALGRHPIVPPASTRRLASGRDRDR